MQDSRVVYEKVQSAKATYGFVYQSPNFTWLGYVRRDCKRRITHLPRQCLNPILPPADQRYSRAFAREGDRACASNSAPCPCNDPDLALQTFAHDELV
jgi:hypothetical protein